jgi:hypothetical protein
MKLAVIPRGWEFRGLVSVERKLGPSLVLVELLVDSSLGVQALQLEPVSVLELARESQLVSAPESLAREPELALVLAFVVQLGEVSELGFVRETEPVLVQPFVVSLARKSAFVFS